MVLGAKVYFDAVNAQGGVGGNRIRPVVKDDAYKTDETVRLTKELIDQDKAAGLIGYAGTGNISELLKQGVLASRNVPLVAPYTGGEPLRKPYNPHTFHIRTGYADEIERMVDQFTGGWESAGSPSSTRTTPSARPGWRAGRRPGGRHHPGGAIALLAPPDTAASRRRAA